MLGDIIAAARVSATRFEALLSASNSQLADEVAEAAAQLGVSTSTYARIAVADFSRFASEEDWATLTSSLRDASNPGTVCLLAMIQWRLAVPACGAHSHSFADHHGGSHYERPGREQA